MTMVTHRIPVSAEIPGNQASDSDVDRVITAPAVPPPPGLGESYPPMSAVVELDTGGMFRIVGPQLRAFSDGGSLKIYSESVQVLAAFAPGHWCAYWLEGYISGATKEEVSDATER